MIWKRLLCFVFAYSFLQPATGLSTDDFKIECYSDGFQVALSKQSAKQNGIREFRLKANSCTSVDNATHLVVASTNDYCGTSKRKLDIGYEYSNELLRVVNSIDEEAEKPRCPYFNVKVSCWHPSLYTAHARFRKDTTNEVVGSVQTVKRCKNLIGVGKYREEVAARRHVSSRIGIIAKPAIITCPLLIGVGEALQEDRILTSATVQHQGGIKVKTHKATSVCKPLREQGSFHTTLKLFTDNSYTKELDNNDNENVKQRKIDWFEDVFYEASLLPVHENLHVLPTRCYATPHPDPNSELQYTYISQGCPVDPTVKFYASKSGTSRFSITAFRFHNSESLTFYSHCNLLICDKKDPSSQCQRRCNTVNAEDQGKARRRRAAGAENVIGNNDIIFRSFIGLRKIKNNKQRKNIQTMRMSSRGKSTRYLFLKSVHNTFVTMVIKAPKHLIQGHQYNSPVQFVSSVNRNGDITVKGLVTRNDVRFLINDCYYGSSRLRSRQTLLVKHGCTTTEGFDSVTMTPETVVLDNRQLLSTNPNKRSFFTCSVQVCGTGEDDQCTAPCKNSRKKRSVNREPDTVEVFCFSNHMLITVKKKSTADRKQLHLIDPQCIATQNNTHYVLRSGLNECETTLTTQDGVRYYKNEINEKLNTQLAIIRRPLLKRSVSCAYNTRSVSAPVKIELERQTLRGDAIGRYQVNIDMYQDNTFTKKPATGLVEVDETSDMYFEVSITNEQFSKNLALHLDACLGYPLHRNDRRQIYTFIEDGCAIDDTVVFYKSGVSTKVRFSIKPFKFSDNDSNIAINCYVTACNASDKTSKCSKGCQN